MKLNLSWCLLFCLLNTMAIAQNADTMLAKEVLRRCTANNGGDTWQKPETLVLYGDAIFTPYGKTDAKSLIKFDSYRMMRVYPKESDAAHQANGKIRFDAKYGDSLFMQLIFNGKDTKNTLSEKAKPFQKHFSWSNNFGFGIIRFALNDSFKVERLVDDLVDGFVCYMIKITDPKKMTTVFGIDKNNFYIRYLGFATDQGYHHRIYSEFVRRDIIINTPDKTDPRHITFTKERKFFVQPKRLRIYFEGVKWMDIHWREFAVNEKIGDEIFEGN
jgi:hypothetical protein